MLVEFVGCSGAGKTTIACQVLRELAQAGIAFERLDVGGHIQYDFKAIPWYMGFARRNRALTCLARDTLCQQAASIWEELNLYRNFAKKMGIGAWLAQKKSGSKILWDEGTVHASHNLFVHAVAEPDMAGVKAFARLVPLPDLIVYIRAPQPVLVDRIRRGGHKRVKRQADVPAFVDHAERVFDTLLAEDRLQEKVLVVENNKNSLVEIESLARTISVRIAGWPD